MTNKNVSMIDYSCLSPKEFEEEMRHEKMCAEMNDVVGHFLCRTYPGYPWGINANIKMGIVNIFLQLGDGNAPYGVTVKLDSSMQSVLGKCAHFAGELLERYGLRRGKMNADEFGRLMETRDGAGRLKVDEG